MKQFKKTILAGALMVVAGGAHANLATQLSTNTATSGSNEAFLVAFDAAYVNSDSSLGRTFNLDLGTTFGALLASPSTALATFIGGKDLSTDANWATFIGAGATSSITYGVFAAGDLSGNPGTNPNKGAFYTGTATPLIPPTGDWYTTISAIDTQAGDINSGLSVTNALGQNTPHQNTVTGVSSVILNTDSIQSGQANGHNPLSQFFGAMAYDPSVAYGASENFYHGATHLGSVVSHGGATPKDQIALTDISNVGTFNLSGNALAFTPAVTAVPLPAAVWLFGAGLMGFLRLNRRKSV